MIYYIYKVTCEENDKSYIGFTNNFERRMRAHIKDANKGSKYALHAAIRKYGWETFATSVIYASMDKNHTLHEMEDYFIEQYDSRNNGYNMTRGGQSREGYKNKEPRKPLTEEQRKRIGEATKLGMANPEIIKKISEGLKQYYSDHDNVMKGKIHTEEARQNMSQGHLNNMNDETKKKIGEASRLMWLDPVIREKHHIARTNYSQETRTKMSVAKKGKIPWNKGISPKPESIEKRKQTLIAKGWKMAA